MSRRTADAMGPPKTFTFKRDLSERAILIDCPDASEKRRVLALVRAAPDLLIVLRAVSEQILTATDADRIRLQALARTAVAKAGQS